MARSKVVRGWLINSGEIVVTNTTVDNVITQSESVLDGSDIDYGPIAGEAESQFVVRRILLWMWIFAAPATLNTFGCIPLQLGLVKAEPLVSDGLTGSRVVSNSAWLEGAGRFLQAEYLWAKPQVSSSDFTAFATETFPGNTIDSGMLKWDFAYKGGFNLRQSDQLLLVASQDDVLGGWINTDSVTIRWGSRILLQKRRDG